MKKNVYLFLIFLMLAATSGATQLPDTTRPQMDTLKIFNKFSDSLYAHTSLKDFRDFLYQTITGKWFVEGRFDEHWDYYRRQQFAIWLENRRKK